MGNVLMTFYKKIGVVLSFKFLLTTVTKFDSTRSLNDLPNNFV